MAPTSDYITLHNGPASLRTPQRHVLFAFGDGRLDFDCAACGAACCRGHSYECHAGDVERQVEARPALAFFLAPKHTGRHSVKVMHNLPPRCFFLDSEARCSIHAKQGLSAKPETCRLFPFNRIWRYQQYLVVTPNTSLCPLTLVHRGRSDRSAHCRLFEAMAAQGVRAFVPPVTSRWQRQAHELIACERAIVDAGDLVGHATDYSTYAGIQRQIMTGLGDDGSMRGFGTRVRQILNLTPSGEGPNAAVATMIGATPTLRAEMLFATPGEESYLFNPDRLPHALNVLAIIVELAQRAGVEAPTLQTIWRLYRDYRPLCRVLAYADEPMMLQPERMAPWIWHGPPEQRARYLRLMRALLPAEQRIRRSTLGETLLEHIVGSSVADVMFLKSVLRHLDGQLVNVEGRANTATASGALRVGLQHWALRRCSEAVLLAVADGRQLGNAASPAN